MALETVYWQGAALLGLLALSAFFSMSETALVGADRLEIRHRRDAGDAKAKRLESLLEHPEKLLTTILLGNNLVNIAATALATVISVSYFQSQNTGVAVATVVMTVVVLIFAEITPKSLAVRRALPIALVLAVPLRLVQTVLYPFVVLLTGISRGLLALVGVKTDANAPFITQAQIESLVRMGAQEGEVERFEERVITEVFDFTETDVHLIMTPREKVRYVEKSYSMREALELSAGTGHSRMPVVDGSFDHVLGFVHVKDLLRYTDQELEDDPVTDVLRGVLFVQHDTPSHEVLVRMQREHKLMAIIQDDFGHNIGIATAEDLLEELVGEITDEFDAGARGFISR